MGIKSSITLSVSVSPSFSPSLSLSCLALSRSLACDANMLVLPNVGRGCDECQHTRGLYSVYYYYFYTKLGHRLEPRLSISHASSRTQNLAAASLLVSLVSPVMTSWPSLRVVFLYFPFQYVPEKALEGDLSLSAALTYLPPPSQQLLANRPA